MRKCWPIMLCFALAAGCGSPSIKANAGTLTQAQANAITAKCGGPKEMLEVRNGELTFTHTQNFDITSCIMKGLDATGVTNFAGSVGNKMYQALDR